MMNQFFNSKHVLAGTLLAAALLTTSNHTFASTSRSSNADVGVSNDFLSGQNTSFAVLDFDSSSTGDFVSSSFSGSYTGFDNDGFERTMNFTGSSSAASEFGGRLRTRAQASVTNSFYNPDSNDPYFDYENGIINDGEIEGVPTDFIVNGEASFTDTLQYGGTATGYTSRYLLNLSGTITGDGGAFVFVEFSHGTSGQSQSFFFSENGSYNIPIATETFVGGPNQTFSIRMLSSFQESTEFFFDGDSFSGTSAFGNTLELVGVEVRDEVTGELLDSSQVVGTSGASYSVQVVPEPGSLALLGLGGLCALRRRR
ncbi:MAG: PEP-CTERM sorting domain-containing protein [Planctomycetota bacterium]